MRLKEPQREHISKVKGEKNRYQTKDIDIDTFLRMVTAAMKLKDGAPWKESYEKPRQRIKKQRHPFADKGPYSQNYGFSSSHVWM